MCTPSPTSVGRRLTELREGIHFEAPESTALVLVSREKRVEDFIKETYGDKIRQGRSAKGAWTGREAGREAGRKADIGQAAVKGDKAAVTA